MPPSTSSKVLVAGSTGLLGGAIVRKLLAKGVPVRALARNRDKLKLLEAQGAEIAPVDYLNLAAVTDACRGVTEIITTANNNMGKGPTSPGRVDLSGHQNLCAAARNTGVKRLTYVSFHGVSHDVAVDIFKLKWYIEDAIRRSGVPHVFLRPTAFMDIWADELMAKSIRKTGKTMIFGDGTAVANYIAVDDVADFVLGVLDHPEIVNEAIEAGGPSDISFNDLATLVEKRLGASGKRRHIPVAAMKILSPVLRPFNEVAARMMSLGLFAATQSEPFPGWKAAADRFGLRPRTIEEYVAAMAVK